MSRLEHLLAAERLLARAEKVQWTRECELLIMMAQVHATLACSEVGA